VIAALSAGMLPREHPVRIWAGAGTDTCCALCGDCLTPADIEYEIEFVSGASVTFDRSCYAIWNEQRAAAPPGACSKHPMTSPVSPRERGRRIMRWN
jgi:hypothetical protein